MQLLASPPTNNASNLYNVLARHTAQRYFFHKMMRMTIYNLPELQQVANGIGRDYNEYNLAFATGNVPSRPPLPLAFFARTDSLCLAAVVGRLTNNS